MRRLVGESLYLCADEQVPTLDEVPAQVSRGLSNDLQSDIVPVGISPALCPPTGETHHGIRGTLCRSIISTKGWSSCANSTTRSFE